MSTVRIVTDSTSDIPAELREQLGIEMIPLQVIFGSETFLDNVTLTPEQFYEKLQSATVMPTTSQPSPIQFMEAYERILNEQPGASIISMHLSAKFSGTYQSATIGASMLERDADISVYDSKSASYGIGMLVVRAAQLAQQGKSKAEILEDIEQMNEDKKLYFLVDTLEYLQKGGRIGRASALIGSILNIKPIMTIDSEGYVNVKDKVRGQKKAVARILELMERDFGKDPVDLTIAWTNVKDLAIELGELTKTNLNVRSVHHTWIGPVIGAHVGPGAAALFINRVRGSI
ncbi:DegV family protein with EDD domain [Paenibacillus phyllosphaerae]|uniref:DegV family protein with EDD domain n=1 Tax=Paenibacillus phyllosphaerae TaxID=274593 RepID=A0A7W5FMU6_9BACL|nr:DegV family protein with EDD domain [Paenibacillus phyllosphaerae]